MSGLIAKFTIVIQHENKRCPFGPRHFSVSRQGTHSTPTLTPAPRYHQGQQMGILPDSNRAEVLPALIRSHHGPHAVRHSVSWTETPPGFTGWNHLGRQPRASPPAAQFGARGHLPLPFTHREGKTSTFVWESPPREADVPRRKNRWQTTPSAREKLKDKTTSDH